MKSSENEYSSVYFFFFFFFFFKLHVQSKSYESKSFLRIIISVINPTRLSNSGSERSQESCEQNALLYESTFMINKETKILHLDFLTDLTL